LKACGRLIAASDELKNSDGYQYDLVDVTRQVLANYATVLQQSFATDYRNKNYTEFDKKSKQFLQLIDDMDALLATRKDFLLGRWLNSAKRLGSTDKERKLFERNARDLITLWLDKDCNIHEYACKEWSGMLKGFYKPRWEKFFEEVHSQIKKGQQINQEQFENNIKVWEWQWVNGNEQYPEKPVGDPVQTAKALYAKYAPVIKQFGN